MTTNPICSNCGTQNEPDHAFCMNCGESLAVQVKAEPEKPAPIFEPGYSNPPEKYCPKCHAPNPKGARFCHSCQHDFESQSIMDRIKSFFSFLNQATSPDQGPTYTKTNRIDKLGERLDGWADVVVGGADQAEVVKTALFRELSQRNFPEVHLADEQLTPGMWSNKKRPYNLFRQHAGATQIFYVGKFGSDLYLTWEAFYKPVLNWRNLRRMLAAAALLALLTSCSTTVSLMGVASNLGLDAVSFGALFGLCTGFFGSLIAYTIGIFILAGIAGLILKRNLLHFFFIEIDAFTADDIAAMIISGHKALQHSVDAVGLDISGLRVKRDFVGGKAGRLI